MKTPAEGGRTDRGAREGGEKGLGHQTGLPAQRYAAVTGATHGQRPWGRTRLQVAKGDTSRVGGGGG